MPEPQVKTINALARGLDVLTLLQSSGQMTLGDLHRRTGIPKASLLRILKTLRARGMVWQRMADGAYVASYSLAELAGHMDREQALAEVASPILERLSDRIKWPSVLAVPRLTHMEVIETNAPRAYIENIPLGPVGFRINMLRSASGRAYLAFCQDTIREAILDRLRQSGEKGDRLAHSPDYVARFISDARAQGFAFRDPDFGGDFNEPRSAVDDARDSLAVPIRLAEHVPAALNVTWSRKVFRRDQARAQFASAVQDAAADIAQAMNAG